MRTVGRRSILQGAAAIGSGAVLEGCCSFGRGSEWRNNAGNVRVIPDERVFPSSAREISELVQEAESSDRRIRMTGSGHSFSDVAVTHDVLLGPNCLDESLEVDGRRLRTDRPKNAGSRLMRVESGMRIRELNACAWDRGLSVRNLGGYDAQTIVGAAITGTHGTGLAYGPIASQIVSMQVVSKGGKVLQIEPSSGITDRARFPEHLEEDEDVPVELVQNDDVFHSVAVSLGCMGIVYSVTLDVEPRFWIRERRTLTTWSALAAPGGFVDQLVKNGAPDPKPGKRAPEFYDILFSPYAVHRGGVWEHSCVLTERWKLDREPRKSLDELVRGKAYTDLATVLSVPLNAGGGLAALYAKHPESVPKFHQTSLIGLEDTGAFVDRSYQVFHLGPANEVRALGVELAFDLSQTKDAFARACSKAAEERSMGRMLSWPLSMRFVGESKSYLAMQYGRPTMMLEIGMFADNPYAESLLLDYETMFMSEMQARPHWGLDFLAIHDTATIAALYPKWPAWRAVYDSLNPRGTFSGDFTDRIGLSQPRW